MKKFKAFFVQLFTGKKTLCIVVNKKDNLYVGVIKSVLTDKSIMYSAQFPSNVKSVSLDSLKEFLQNTVLQAEINSVYSENKNIRLKRAFYNIVLDFEQNNSTNQNSASMTTDVQKEHLFITTFSF